MYLFEREREKGRKRERETEKEGESRSERKKLLRFVKCLPLIGLVGCILMYEIMIYTQTYI